MPSEVHLMKIGANLMKLTGHLVKEGKLSILSVTGDDLTFYYYPGAYAATQSIDLTLENVGEAGSTLNWLRTGLALDLPLDGLWTSAPTSGALAFGATEAVTCQIVFTTLAAGTYTGTITHDNPGNSGQTDTRAILVYCYPSFVGTIPVSCVGTNGGSPYSYSSGYRDLGGSNLYFSNATSGGIKIETFAYYATDPGGWHAYGPGWTGPGWYCKTWDSAGHGYDGIVSVQFSSGTGRPMGTFHAVTPYWNVVFSFGDLAT